MSIIRRISRRAKHHAHVGTHIRQDRWMRALWRARRAGAPHTTTEAA